MSSEKLKKKHTLATVYYKTKDTRTNREAF